MLGNVAQKECKKQRLPDSRCIGYQLFSHTYGSWFIQDGDETERQEFLQTCSYNGGGLSFLNLKE